MKVGMGVKDGERAACAKPVPTGTPVREKWLWDLPMKPRGLGRKTASSELVPWTPRVTLGAQQHPTH